MTGRAPPCASEAATAKGCLDGTNRGLVSMTKSTIDRRTFNHMLAMSLGATTLATVPAWAQGKKRNVVIGHTGITWPARAGGRRGGGASGAAPGGAGAGGAAGSAAPQGAGAPAA